jgi:hypothetical protein
MLYKVAKVLLKKCFEQPTPELNPNETLKLGGYAYQVLNGEGGKAIE